MREKPSGLFTAIYTPNAQLSLCPGAKLRQGITLGTDTREKPSGLFTVIYTQKTAPAYLSGALGCGKTEIDRLRQDKDCDGLDRRNTRSCGNDNLGGRLVDGDGAGTGRGGGLCRRKGIIKYGERRVMTVLDAS
jgi:hypothetical protein